MLTLLLAIVAAVVLGLGAFLPALRSRIWPAVVALVAAVVILLILIINVVNGAKTIGQAAAVGASIGLGWGLILLFVGALVLTAGTVVQLLLVLKANKARSTWGQFPGGPQGYTSAQHPYAQRPYAQPPQQYGQQPPYGHGQPPRQG